MSTYQISVNQIISFGRSTESGKRTIIKQQLNPSVFKAPRYQKTKAEIKRFFNSKGDLKPIHDAMQALRDSKPETKWKLNDRDVSIEALKKLIEMKLPGILRTASYEVIKPEKKKGLEVGEVEIKVAPEIIIKARIKDKTIIGAVKIHISKTKPFSLDEAQDVSSIIFHYLKKEVAKEGESVLPELCFCLDIFGERLVPAPTKAEHVFSKIVPLCEEVKILWNKLKLPSK